MIEIIEKPQHKCEKCGCVFSFDKEDVRSLSIKGKDVVVQKFVPCPICECAYGLYGIID